ncbi:MAG: FG-GAP-like repeat-containing protein [Phycisphaerae bacterium]|jgi:hypothetical protein|nr:FG-GAP-like repeat-containing protein [Phycisphaerae bacterium]
MAPRGLSFDSDKSSSKVPPSSIRPILEILEPRLLLDGVDFGDAPAPYPTTLASDGARHADTGPTLAVNRDTESDGKPTAAADGDDNTGVPDDEDGVTFGSTIRAGQLGAEVTVNVLNAPSGAKLDAWIDFNSDGTWGGPYEQIADSVAVVNGDNTITFDVPSWAVDGQTYARFRLSTAGGLGPAGLAVDGEVEDYQVMIASPSLASGAFEGQSVISSAAIGARSVFAADVDGDGDLDVLSVSQNDSKIAWHENDGSGNWTLRTISTAPDTPNSVSAADLDGDGDLDVLSASHADDKIAWYENNGNQSFTENTISTDADLAWSIFAADVDGDGDLDVLSTSVGINKIVWYENDGSENFTENVISTAGAFARSLFAADVDGDGDLDVLSASPNDDRIAWYENNGIQDFAPHTISTAADGARSVFAADVDGDGDVDVLSASSNDNKIAWYENDGSGNFTPYTISTAAGSASSVFAADVDGDGDTDVLSASPSDDKIAWYENDGSENFTENIISTDADYALSVFAADVDGDGDLDVLSASYSDHKIAWYEHVDPFDYGDTPLPYPTTLAENGARHTATGPTLGSYRDEEVDGTHSPGADADDTTGTPDDEDGVTFGSTIMVGQLAAGLTVNASAAGCRLDAWIDFNADGTWGGPYEQIANSVALAAGDNTITFDVPSWAVDGQTYARFRLSTTGGLGPAGLAVDGEVEDYQVAIASPSPGGVFVGQNVISISDEWPMSIFAADIDGDGDMDMLSSAGYYSKIAWYENDSSGNFTRHTIPTDANAAVSIFAADVDGDGDTDVLSASIHDNTVAWYENDGRGNFTQYKISNTAYYARSVFTADVDGDGDMDVLAALGTIDTIVWYENDGSENFTERTVTTDADNPISVFAADVDGDGDMDVLSAIQGDHEIAWYENDGSENFTPYTISSTAYYGRSVFAADVDGDGDMDVLSALDTSNKIAWYENDGSQNFTERIITTAADYAYSVFAADIDGDGDMDVLSASRDDSKIAWYENDGSGNFTPYTISIAANYAYSVFAADIDGDGDLDVLSASARDNKIAWYENVGLDFGDAPSPYPTTLADNGARHTHAAGAILGAGSDTELDGAPSAGADGDDLDGVDDDGVTFGMIHVGQLDAGVTVNASAAGSKLDAWIDFNADGTWGGPLEQIADSVALSAGDNAIAFDVPSWAVDGPTYARFRLSTSGGLGPSGPATDGEVEDYQVTIASPSLADGVFGEQNVISTAADRPTSVFAADIDGDGDMDALSASGNDNKIAWYENDGSGDFTPYTISTAADSAGSVFAADVDGDGDTDVLSASRNDDKIAWYENDGSGNFTAYTVSNAADWPTSVFAADVDGDGDLDVLSASWNDNKIAWYENDGSGTFTPYTISTDADGAQSVFAADVDGDGDMDVLSASSFDDKIAWYENDGSQNFTPYTISTAAIAAESVFAADVDGDGDMDVLSASWWDHKIAWYKNDGSENFTAYTISTDASLATSVFAADMDGDGDIDVLSASEMYDKIAWYENDGSGNFTTYTISTVADGARSVFAADVDGDGDLDVLSASPNDAKIAWYENISATTDILLSNPMVAENEPVGTPVGTFSTTPDAGDTHTYMLVTGKGDDDNASFSIDVDTLKTGESFNFEAESNYTIRIRSTDQGGLWYEEPFTINVTNINEQPIDIALSNNTIPENEPVGTVIGALSTADADAGNTFTYSLATGAGSTDNSSFMIAGSILKTAAVFDYETRDSYSIRVRSADQGGLYREKVLVIHVDDVGEPMAFVAARHVFYNNSVWDGDDAAANAADDAAIDPSKVALLPGQTESPDNYTSYSRGINGIMVDIDAPLAAPVLADFQFRIGTYPDPTLTVRPGEGVGGSDRVTLIWPDGAIVDQWIEVTVLATANTDLSADDVFSFGNCVGDSDGDGEVGASDYGVLVGEFGLRGEAGAMAADLNGDGRVGLGDFAIMRGIFGGAEPVPPTTGDIAVNGSFELPDIPANTLDSPTVPGWSSIAFVFDGNGGYPGSYPDAGSDGPQYADFANKRTRIASQEFSVPAGSSIGAITWDATTSRGASQIPYVARLKDGSGAIRETGNFMVFGGASEYNNWDSETLPLTLQAYSAGDYSLEFFADQDSGSDLLADNVVIELVAETHSAPIPLTVLQTSAGPVVESGLGVVAVPGRVTSVNPGAASDPAGGGPSAVIPSTALRTSSDQSTENDNGDRVAPRHVKAVPGHRTPNNDPAAIDLLGGLLSVDGYISEPQAISGGSSATRLQRAATSAYDLRPLSDAPASDAPGDDLLADILAESTLAVRL